MLDRYCRLQLLASVIERGSGMLPGLEGLARAALKNAGREPPRVRRAGMLCALRMRRYNELVHNARKLHDGITFGQMLLQARHPSWTWSKQANAKRCFLDLLVLAQRQLNSIDRLMPKISLFG